eukprot:TRINITY_DN2095_c0_g1_i2.p2 TRINITY_DN2095_c0_g1~~TRINITY_DN2095_c0_g1_i2.p2  ORF type:complete len:214 (-),score=48.63 TRINITY_DN2095_c0_g1_i2:882-1523(-)
MSLGRLISKATKGTSKFMKGLSLKHLEDQPAILPLITFNTPDAVNSWRLISDEVYGGKSKAKFFFEENPKRAVFEGDLSLECPPGLARSGFVATTSPDNAVPDELEEYDALRIKIKGDGRIYTFNIKQESKIPNQLFQYYFTTDVDKWVDIDIPFNQFFLTSDGMLQELNQPFVWRDIENIGFLLSQRKDESSGINAEYGAANQQLSHTLIPH